MSLRHADGREVPVEIDSTALNLDGERMTVEVLRPLERTIRFSQEQRLSTIGLLANGVAHEIHNPLASIRLALQASLRGIRKGNMPTDELVAYLELVDAQIDRCVLTTQRLMQMSVPPNGQLAPVTVQRALDDVLALMSEDARVRHVKIVSHIEPADLAVLADEAELRQIFVNLVQNAMTAMPGGGLVTIEAHTNEEGQVCIRVADTGRGISPDNLSRIFLPFFSRRVDGSRGMGLGLAVCKTILERFGGTIEAGNQVGSGAVLTLTLKPGKASSQLLPMNADT
jgi:signal transduction histidine kinase